MPMRPAVAAAAVVGEDGLGHLARLGGVALLEAGPREQAARPAQPALVADLLEGGGRLAQQHLGLLGPAGVERAPGQVLAGPRHAAPVVERLEAGQRLLEQPGGGGVLVAEQGAEAAEAQHLGLAGRVAERRRTRDRPRRGPPPRPPSSTPSARRRPARAGPGRGRAAPSSPACRLSSTAARASARAGAISRSPASARARPVRKARWRGPWCAGEEAEPLAVEALGHDRDLGLVGAGGRLLEPVQGPLGEVARQARRPGPSSLMSSAART